MRIFGAERMDAMLKRLGLKEDEAIVHPWINKALEKAQQKVEARNFDIRKNILKFDNVMNDQRKVIFEDRRRMMASESLESTIEDMRTGVIDDIVAKHIPHDAYPEAWDIAGLKSEVTNKLNLDLPVDDWAKEEGIADEEVAARLHKAAEDAYARARSSATRPTSCATSKSRSSCSRSTICGASISSRSIICARSSAGAAWRSAIL